MAIVYLQSDMAIITSTNTCGSLGLLETSKIIFELCSLPGTFVEMGGVRKKEAGLGRCLGKKF